MPLVSMRQMLLDAEERNYAVGAFNIFDYTSLHGVLIEAEKQASPVVVQTSVKTANYYGFPFLAGLVRELACSVPVPVALHLDYCTDMEVAVDLSEASLADVDSSVEYVIKSGADAFAPAIGTAHGVYQGAPQIDFERFRAIRERVNVPLVVHGGTGFEEKVFKRLISLGASKINVSTALKMAYRDACMEAARKFSEPLEIADWVEASMSKCISRHLKIFGSIFAAGGV